MTGLHLSAEAVEARRLELAEVESQIRALGRRKSVLRAEILTGYAAPAKGVAAEQLPLLETATATTPATAAPEARVGEVWRSAILDALTREGPLMGQVLSIEVERACHMHAVERPDHRTLAVLRGSLVDSGAVYYDALTGRYSLAPSLAPEPPEDKKSKFPAKAAPKAPKALWKPGYKAGILPSLTAEGNRRVLEMIAAAPGKKMLTSVVRAALDLPDDCCTPSGCYYQGSQAGGDWWGIRDDGPPPAKGEKTSKKPGKKALPAKKTRGAAKGKKTSLPKAEAPAPSPPAPAPPPAPQASRQELIRKAVMDELGHGLATFGELLTTCMRDFAWTSQHMPQTTEVRDVLKALCEEGKVVWDEAKKVYQLPPPPPPEPKKKGKKAPAAPRPTVTVGEAMEKMLAEVSVHDWQQARAEVCEKIAQRKGEPVSVGPLLLKVSCDSNLVGPVLELLAEAGAVSLGYKGKSPSVVSLSAVVSDEEIAHDLQALTRRYVRGLVEDWGADPTTTDLAGNLDQPPRLIDSVLRELRVAEELCCNDGRWSVRSPRASAQARTEPLFDDVEPAPAVEGLEPEGDEP